MKCPIDGSDLMMTDRQGIEIDYCPKCRGVWLDRGELDKLIEKSAPAMAPQAMPQQQPMPPQAQQGYPQYREEPKGYYGHDPRYPKKRKSLLGELFDF